MYSFIDEFCESWRAVGYDADIGKSVSCVGGSHASSEEQVTRSPNIDPRIYGYDSAASPSRPFNSN